MEQNLQFVRSVVARISYELALIVLSVFMLFIASMFLSPTRIDYSLSGGIGQVGWPLPYMASYDEGDAKMIKTYAYNTGAGLVDVGLFYLAIRLVVLVLARKQVR